MENVSSEPEQLPGCMCEYIPDYLRKHIDLIAEKTDAYPSQVVTFALEIGLAVLIGKHGEILRATDATGGRGKIKQKKIRSGSKLSGEGV